METITPETPTGPVLQRPADSTRILAYVIDLFIVIGFSMLPRWGWILGIAYMVTRDALPFLKGQSVGKKAMKLRAVTLQGDPLTGNWNQGIVRNIVLIIPLFPLVELFVWWSSPDRMRLGDQWAGTTVVVDPGSDNPTV